MSVTATPNRAAPVERTRVDATRRPTPSNLRLAAGGIAALIVRDRLRRRAHHRPAPGCDLEGVAERRTADGDCSIDRHVPVRCRHHRSGLLPSGAPRPGDTRAAIPGGPGHSLVRRGRSCQPGRLRPGRSNTAPHTRRRPPPVLGHRQNGRVQRAPGLVSPRGLLPRRGEQPHADVDPPRLGRPLRVGGLPPRRRPGNGPVGAPALARRDADGRPAHRSASGPAVPRRAIPPEVERGARRGNAGRRQRLEPGRQSRSQSRTAG